MLCSLKLFGDEKFRVLGNNINKKIQDDQQTGECDNTNTTRRRPKSHTSRGGEELGQDRGRIIQFFKQQKVNQRDQQVDRGLREWQYQFVFESKFYWRKIVSLIHITIWWWLFSIKKPLNNNCRCKLSTISTIYRQIKDLYRRITSHIKGFQVRYRKIIQQITVQVLGPCS